MKLELKHLAPYLPYRLKLTKDDWGKTGLLVPWIMTLEKGLQIELDYAISTQAKPILRPLSDLTEEIEVDGERFVPIDRFSDMRSRDHICEHRREKAFELLKKDILINRLPYDFTLKLLEWHFDVFGLIEKGLAIDINTLKK